MFVENFKIFDLTHRGLLPLDTGVKSKSLPVLRPPAYTRVVSVFTSTLDTPDRFMLPRHPTCRPGPALYLASSLVPALWVKTLRFYRNPAIDIFYTTMCNECSVLSHISEIII
jgi:hypothetical protein